MAYANPNLLPANLYGFEGGTHAWSAQANTTLSVSTAEFLVGTRSLKITPTAAGSVNAFTVARVAVTAGKRYVYRLPLRMSAATSGRTAAIRVGWFDAVSGGNMLASVSGPTQTVTAQSGWISGNYLTFSAVAPAGAVAASLGLIVNGLAAGEFVNIDDLYFGETVEVSGNLLAYDEYTVETALPEWSGPATFSRVGFTSSITDGYFALKAEPSAAGVLTFSLDRLVPVTPGQTYQVGGSFFRHNPTPGTEITSAWRARVEWYDVNGELFNVPAPDQLYSNSSSLDYYGSTTYSTFTCPAGSAFARVIVEFESVAADAFYLDNLRLRPAEPTYELVTDNDSAAVTLTVNYVPTSDSVTVSVFRMDESGAGTPLRGQGFEYKRAPYAAGPLVVEDYEAPLGQEVWYSIEWFRADGSRTTRIYTRNTPTPVLADADYVWLKSPGLPASNTAVMMESPPSWTRQARSAAYPIVGRARPTHVTGKRAGRSGSIRVLVWDTAAYALLDSLLDTGLPALVQAMPGYGIDGNLYVSVGDAEVESVTGIANEPGWRWTLPITEIDPPEGGLQGSAGLTWQDIFDGYDTWGDLFEAHSSWATVLTEG